MVDIISHGLVSEILALLGKGSRKKSWWTVLFGIIADIPQIFLYLYLGIANMRPFFYPSASDWIGFRAAHPILILLWEIPHSLFFLLLIIIPLVILLKLPKLAIASYSLHIFIDLFTHTGEWSIALFWPLKYNFNGTMDAWAWPLPGLIVMWLSLGVVILLILCLQNGLLKRIFKKE